jgi:aromatic ring hydroxylase
MEKTMMVLTHEFQNTDLTNANGGLEVLVKMLAGFMTRYPNSDDVIAMELGYYLRNCDAQGNRYPTNHPLN